jgi:ATP-dependent DNA helicase RecG
VTRFGQYSSSKVWRKLWKKVWRKTKKTLKTTEIIIEMMTDNPFVTAEEIVGRTGLTRRGVEENIKKLKNNGIIKREDPDKGGKWVVVTAKPQY